MASTIERRVLKLEGRDPAYPYQHLTDEELDEQIAAVAAKIEAEVGMPLPVYVDALQASIDRGQPLPHGVTKAQVQSLIATYRNVAI